MSGEEAEGVVRRSHRGRGPTQMTRGDKLVRILYGAGVKSASLGYTVARVRGNETTVEDGSGEKFTVHTITGRHEAETIPGFWSEFVVLEG